MNYQRIIDSLIERGRLRKKTKGDYIHCHRITPGYDGGEYVDGNITFLTRKEHRIVHRIRWILYRNLQDKWSYIRLGGSIKDEEVEILQKIGARLGGIKTVSIMRKTKTGLFGLTPERKSEIGRNGAKRCQEIKTGIFGQSKEQLRDAQRKGAISRKEKAKNDPDYRKKLSENGKKCAEKIPTEARIRGGKTCGNMHVKSGHLRTISVLGGKAHRGRRQIINHEGTIRRPTLEEAERLVSTGEWQYLKRAQ